MTDDADGAAGGPDRSVLRRVPRAVLWPVVGAAALAVLLVAGPGTQHLAPQRPSSALVVAAPTAPVVPAPPAPRADLLPATGEDALHWVRTWQAAQQAPPPGSVAASGLGTRTFRMRARTSVGGTALRLTLSNLYGSRPLAVTGVSVGRPEQAEGRLPDARPGSLRSLAFGGAAGVTVPPRSAVTSDPVALVVPARADLLVSVALSGPPVPLTGHVRAESTTWVSVGGDHTGDAAGTAFTAPLTTSFAVAALDVLPVAAAALPPPVAAAPTRTPTATAVRTAAPGGTTGPAGSTVVATPPRTATLSPTLTPTEAPSGAADAATVVAFGDSITDGVGSTVDADRRWPDRLADRLPNVAVANAGISGNRLLRGSARFGAAGLERFDRDTLGVPGVRVVVVLQGINDIQQAPRVTRPAPLVDALAALGDRAHARGVRVVLVTLTPYGGRAAWTPVGERTRRAVNDWVRRDAVRLGHADAVVDADAVLRDPADPTRLRAAFDCGDRIHPSDAGYAALAAAVEPAVRGLLAPAPAAAGVR